MNGMSRLAAELDDLGGADITGALEELPVRSFVVDGEGVVRWQNAASLAAIGDWAGRKWYEVVSENQTQELEAVVRRIICSASGPQPRRTYAPPRRPRRIST